MSWNVFQLTSSSPMPLSTNVSHWAVNGVNIEIPSTCAYMRRNLTWLDKTHAFTLWEGFKAQGCMPCPHNLWDRPCFHQCSSCILIVIICHSHQRNHCRNSLEMSWNTFQLKIPSPIPLCHRRQMLSSEWGQCWNPFNLCLYASKFDMVR